MLPPPRQQRSGGKKAKRRSLCWRPPERHDRGKGRRKTGLLVLLLLQIPVSQLITQQKNSQELVRPPGILSESRAARREREGDGLAARKSPLGRGTGEQAAPGPACSRAGPRSPACAATESGPVETTAKRNFFIPPWWQVAPGQGRSREVSPRSHALSEGQPTRATVPSGPVPAKASHRCGSGGSAELRTPSRSGPAPRGTGRGAVGCCGCPHSIKQCKRNSRRV